MTETLPCLLLPLAENNIILPSSAVAEIQAYEKPAVISDIPNWLVGIITWRGIHVPLVYLEKVESHLIWNEINKTHSDEAKAGVYMAIINRIYRNKTNASGDSDGQYPFIAIVLKGVPKLFRVSKENIKLVSQKSGDDPRIIMEVKIQNDYAGVPDLTYLWKIIDALPPRLQWFRQIIL